MNEDETTTSDDETPVDEASKPTLKERIKKIPLKKYGCRAAVVAAVAAVTIVVATVVRNSNTDEEE